jgi:hypothetical protein
VHAQSKCARQNLRPLDAEPHPIILDRRQGGLGNAGTFGKLILGHVLKLADDPH